MLAPLIMSVFTLSRQGSHATFHVLKCNNVCNPCACVLMQHIQLHVCVPVSERSDDQSVSVAQVFIAELELGVTDVNVTVSGFVIPAMA